MAAWGTQKRGVDDLVELLRRNETGPSMLLLRSRLLDEEGLRAICGALAVNTSLEELVASGHSISQQGASYMAEALRENNILQRLSIGCGSFGDEELQCLLHDWTNITLKELDLGAKSLTASAGNHLGVMLGSAPHRLEVLILSKNKLGNEGMSTLARGLGGPTSASLRKLDLAETGIGKDGCQALGEALCGVEAYRTAPLELKLEQNPELDGEALEALLPTFLPKTEVKYGIAALYLDRCSIDDRGFNSLCKSMSCENSVFSKIERLSVGWNKITNLEGLDALLEGSNCLRFLDLRKNNVGFEGFSTLSNTMRFPRCQITELNLTSIGLEFQSDFNGASSNLASNSALMELNLMGNKLGEDGVEALLRAFGESSLSNITRIAIGAVGLTRKAEPMLVECVKKLKHLQYLELGGNDLMSSVDFQEKMGNARPGLTIAMDGTQDQSH